MKTKKEKRKATVTKNELTRNQLKICQKNQLKYRYILTQPRMGQTAAGGWEAMPPRWFSSKENMTFIRHDLNKHFIMAIKSNRTVSTSEDKKKQGKFTRIDSLLWSSQEPVRRWLKGLDFPVLLHRQVFTNSGATPSLFKTLGNAHQDEDGSTGILYLACSDFDCNISRLETIYQKRWKVEVFHKTLKSNTGLAKSPTKSVRTQSNHIFMSIYAAFQLECLKLKHKMNHFALSNRIYVTALKQAMCELHSLKSA